ncbi:hypothetical protein [Streptomyces ureilyticus]|uniref:Uncharacterized protein n=1 Tax=Streptomyces ureilyticus TaxID=1775131 RepID=A0ABX0DXD3_9ACTN|nr:hypothetical protein [Streptomyces ureilyticus]NGO43771.1 hypothetical protein [Streptomyces ureilyticus]
MTARWPIARPTESAAIRAAGRSARPLPPVEALFAHLVITNAARDRHGSNLIGHAIARRCEGDLL